jgi:hypothetical protein
MSGEVFVDAAIDKAGAVGAEWPVARHRSLDPLASRRNPMTSPSSPKVRQPRRSSLIFVAVLKALARPGAQGRASDQEVQPSWLQLFP